MTLSEIVTVAPVALPAPDGIHTPPPRAANGRGAESLNPPVMVTRLIETVGWSIPSGSPIVTTGPPPSIVVAPAPAPTSCTLFEIVIPPANVPGPIAIVSPSCAASSAAWIVGKHPAFAPTHSVAAERAGSVVAAEIIAITAGAATHLPSVERDGVSHGGPFGRGSAVDATTGSAAGVDDFPDSREDRWNH